MERKAVEEKTLRLKSRVLCMVRRTVGRKYCTRVLELCRVPSISYPSTVRNQIMRSPRPLVGRRSHAHRAHDDDERIGLCFIDYGRSLGSFYSQVLALWNAAARLLTLLLRRIKRRQGDNNLLLLRGPRSILITHRRWHVSPLSARSPCLLASLSCLVSIHTHAVVAVCDCFCQWD
jgi:hypothetical protein